MPTRTAEPRSLDPAIAPRCINKLLGRAPALWFFRYIVFSSLERRRKSGFSGVESGQVLRAPAPVSESQFQQHHAGKYIQGGNNPVTCGWSSRRALPLVVPVCPANHPTCLSGLLSCGAPLQSSESFNPSGRFVSHAPMLLNRHTQVPAGQASAADPQGTANSERPNLTSPFWQVAMPKGGTWW